MKNLRFSNANITVGFELCKRLRNYFKNLAYLNYINI